MQSGIRNIVLAFILGITLSGYGQDVIYSQFYANPLYLNPALAGVKLCPRLTFNYRNQWPDIRNGYVSYSATYDDHIEAISGGIGVVVNANIGGAGIYNTFNGSLIYSNRVRISRSIVLNTAIKGGYMQKRINWDKVVFGDQINFENGLSEVSAENRPSSPQIGRLDLSAGILAGYKESVYVGFTMDHLNTPNTSFYNDNSSRMNIRYTAHAGAIFDFRQGMEGEDIRNFSLSPNVVYIQDGKFHQLNMGMSVNTYPFVLGMWFRHNYENPDAMILLIGFQQKQYKVGYSFDYTVSRLKMQTGGAHEVSIAWLFNTPSKKFRYRELKCPSF